MNFFVSLTAPLSALKHFKWYEVGQATHWRIWTELPEMLHPQQ